ncbi:ribonuclease toxin immunity protein CdiI [Lysinibacillus sphaericus]|uniref:ribonuclease toxin immunity protein CdiI n=1 Tax=Lysinibacillus sphaericus TaxID=1421 RepID=UPI001CBAA757|nr:ribonuclease toxin immunity protein CdiI [Lysinibacillus sphaericus]
MEKLLNSNELISIEHSPVKDLINACYVAGVFKDAVKYLSNKVGFGIDIGGFTFWSDLDEYDKTFYEDEFNGIEIELGTQSVILSYELLYYYLKIAGERYIEKNPQNEKEFELYFSNIKRNMEMRKR